MWQMKLKLNPEKLFFGSLALKYKVAIIGRPLSFFHKNNNLLLQVNGVVLGKNREAFTKELTKSKRILAIESNGDYIVASYVTKYMTKWLNNDHLIHAAHLFIDTEGQETLTLESFTKASLQMIYTILHSKYNAILITLKHTKASTLPLLRPSPDLTAKQQYAFELAIREGYYKSPRKTTVKNLATKAKLAYSTFQQHLRKAESKLLPE